MLLLSKGYSVICHEYKLFLKCSLPSASALSLKQLTVCWQNWRSVPFILFYHLPIWAPAYSHTCHLKCTESLSDLAFGQNFLKSLTPTQLFFSQFSFLGVQFLSQFVEIGFTAGCFPVDMEHGAAFEMRKKWISK